MRLSFHESLNDFKAAFRLHRRQTVLRRFAVFIWFAVTIAFFAIAFMFDVKSELFNQIFSIGVGTLWVSIVIPIARWMSVRKSYKRLFPKSGVDNECYAEVDNEYVSTGVVGKVEFKFAWERITGFVQDEEITLFYTSKNQFLFFPTQAMSSEEKKELNDLVARNVVKR